MRKILLFINFISLIYVSRSQTLEWANFIQEDYTYLYCHSSCVDNQGFMYNTGCYNHNVDFDPGPESYFLSTEPGEINIFIQKLDSSGNFVWAQSFGRGISGSGSEAYSCSIINDKFSNIYITGYFERSISFASAGGPTIHSGGSFSGDECIFVMKMDSSGNCIWAKPMGLNPIGYPTGTSITVDSLGNIYSTGRFAGYLYDPATFGPFSINHGGIYILKQSSDGEVVWVKTIAQNCSSNLSSRGVCIDIDKNGNVYTTGIFLDPADFDPGDSTYNITPSDIDIYILKLDSLGNFIWVNTYDVNNPENNMFSIGGEHNLLINDNGYLYLAGSFYGTVDFNSSSQTNNLTSAGGVEDIFILKLDTSGNYIWSKRIGSTWRDNCFKIYQDEFDFLYAIGKFYGSVDFDPGVGVNYLESENEYNSFLLKLDSNSNFIWARSLGTAGISSVQLYNNNIYLTGGFKNTIDIDPDTSVYELFSWKDAIYFSKWVQDSCTNMILVINSISSISCDDSLGFVNVSTLHGVPPYSYSWNNSLYTLDSIAAFEASGIHELIVTDSIGCTKDISVFVDGPTSFSGYDLTANLVCSSFRPGLSSSIWLDAYNDGCTTISGQLILILDSLVQYETATIIPDNISGDTLIWYFNNLVFDSIHFIPQIIVSVEPYAIFGDSVYFDVLIFPIIGDVDTTNNIREYKFEIINSYDSNDKKIYPNGYCDSNYVLFDNILTYTIRFQNTGNDSAINVCIIDSLDPNLNLSSFDVISSSHELITEILPNNILQFGFFEINLPDTASNNQESQGYIIFQINSENGLPMNTVINNSADIYFDYNDPVKTNSVFITLTNNIPDCTNNVNDVNNIDNKLLIYPNPTTSQLTINSYQMPISKVNIYDIAGLKILSIEPKSNTINVSELPKGIYIINIFINDHLYTKKLVKL